MSAEERRAFQQALSRIESLITTLNGLPDASAGAPARELVQVVLDLHASGLAKLLELTAESEGGHALLERLAVDEQVQGLLVLHGLHPEELDTRVRKAVGRLHAHLGVHGVRVAAVDTTHGVARLQIQVAGRAGSKRLSVAMLRREIEDMIFEAAPDLEDIQIEGLEEPGTVVYVPLSKLARPRASRHGEAVPGKA